MVSGVSGLVVLVMVVVVEPKNRVTGISGETAILSILDNPCT